MYLTTCFFIRETPDELSAELSAHVPDAHPLSPQPIVPHEYLSHLSQTPPSQTDPDTQAPSTHVPCAHTGPPTQDPDVQAVPIVATSYAGPQGVVDPLPVNCVLFTYKTSDGM